MNSRLPRVPLLSSLVLLAGALLAVAWTVSAARHSTTPTLGDQLVTWWPMVALAVGLLLALRLIRDSSSEAPIPKLDDNSPFGLPVLAAVGSTQFAGFGGALNASFFAFVLLLGFWVQARVRNPQTTLRLPLFSWLLGLFLFIVLLSTVGRSLGLFSPLGVAPKFLSAVILVDLVRTRRQVKLCFLALFVTVGIGSLVGIAQVTAATFSGIEWTLSEPHVSHRYGTLRASGFTSSPGQYSSPLAAVVAISVGLLATRVRSVPRRWVGLSLALAATALVLSSTRSTWVGVGVGLLAVPFILRPSAAPVWVAGLGGTAALAKLVGLFPTVASLVGSVRPGSVTERVELFQAGGRALFEYPWRGVGYGNFSSFYEHPFDYPVHTGWLQVGSETGVLGAVVYLSLWALVSLHLLRAIRQAPEPDVRGELMAVFIGLVVLFVAMQAQTAGWSYFYYTYLALGETAARTVLDPTNKGKSALLATPSSQTFKLTLET